MCIVASLWPPPDVTSSKLGTFPVTPLPLSARLLRILSQALKRALDHWHCVTVPARCFPQQPEVLLVAGNQFWLSHLVLSLDGLLDHQVVVQPEARRRPDRNRRLEGDDSEFQRRQADDRH